EPKEMKVKTRRARESRLESDQPTVALKRKEKKKPHEGEKKRRKEKTAARREATSPSKSYQPMGPKLKGRRAAQQESEQSESFKPKVKNATQLRLTMAGQPETPRRRSPLKHWEKKRKNMNTQEKTAQHNYSMKQMRSASRTRSRGTELSQSASIPRDSRGRTANGKSKHEYAKEQ
ncbi:unnamed protein product, partial [Prorocentrum cordatum]